MVTRSDIWSCCPLLASTRKTGEAVIRPLLLSCVLGALIALASAELVLAEPAGPAAATPVANISPELNGLPVDGLEYRVAQQQYDRAANALSTAKSLLASSAAELTSLQLEGTRLTNDLADATERKKEATVTRAQARAGLRALAIDSYVHGQPDPSTEIDANVATQLLSTRTLTQAVSEEQVKRLQAANDALDSSVRTINADLIARTTGRQRMAIVQATHDQAAADETHLTADLVNQQANLDRTRVTATVVSEDFSLVALDAYWKAAKAMAGDDPACGIAWWALAGITRSESRHGTYGGARLLANGDTDRVILGVPLDGTNNTAVIADTDGGLYDGDPVYDHAVGPMQFIPSTWRRWARDGNGDGLTSPNNIYDAALAAAHYLCASGPMQSDDQLRRGFLSYNHSDSYATTVLNYAKTYAQFRIA
jgi:membrane-bound lytic murein transglycosylase B